MKYSFIWYVKKVVFLITRWLRGITKIIDGVFILLSFGFLNPTVEGTLLDIMVEMLEPEEGE